VTAHSKLSYLQLGRLSAGALCAEWPCHAQLRRPVTGCGVMQHGPGLEQRVRCSQSPSTTQPLLQQKVDCRSVVGKRGCCAVASVCFWQVLLRVRYHLGSTGYCTAARSVSTAAVCYAVYMLPATAGIVHSMLCWFLTR
jgi:hypothetical protein